MERWADHLAGLLSAEQARTLSGLASRDELDRQVAAGRVLRLTTSAGEPVYPGVQFGHNGEPFPVLPEILSLFATADANPWTVASFLASPQRPLGGSTPQDWLTAERESAAVVEVARRVAARLAL